MKNFNIQLFRWSRGITTAVIFSAVVAGSMPAVAQLNESVTVEGKYNKEVLYPEKLPRLPERRRLFPEQNELHYQLGGVEAVFTPAPAPMEATAYGARRTNIPPRGYVNFEMGSWLNTSLEAGYTILDSSNEFLNVWLNHNSTSLWTPYKKDDYENLTKRKSYQEALAARYNRLIAGVGRLDLGLRYRLGYFNYYGVEEHLPIVGMPAPTDYTKFVPTQTINDFSFNASLSSERDAKTLNLWNAGAGVRYFAMRTGTREANLHINGGYARRFSSSYLGIDANVNGLFYSSAPGTLSPDSYGNVSLSPYYRYNQGNFGVKVGANMYLTFDADAVTDNNHYSVFHISPDITFDYNNGRFAGWIHAQGGQELFTMASLADENLYCFPLLQSTTPLYSPIDATAGLRLTPFGGFTAEAEFRYKVSRNVAGTGWCIPLLADKAYGYAARFLPEFDTPEGTIATYGMGRARYNLNGWSARMKLAYNISDVAEIAADATYTPQNSDRGIYNGIDRPRWLLSTGLKLHPVKNVTIGVDYEYRGVRNVWSALENVEIAGDGVRAGGIAIPGPGSEDILEENPSGKAVGLRLPDITRLNADVEWQLPAIGALKNVTIGAHARNLLNRREMLLPMLPSEGVTVSGSLQILF